MASGSMEPSYPVGSLVFTHWEPPGAIRVGDCITYAYGEDTVTHRVVRVDEEKRRFVTKGDANAVEDRPVDFSRLVGRTEPFCLPYLGYFVIWLKNGGGVFLLGVLILTASLLIAAKTLPRRWPRLRRTARSARLRR